MSEPLSEPRDPVVAAWIVYYPDPVHRPWKCPVCDGAGKVSRPPYIAGDQQSWASSGIKTYPCTSCGGTGIVWG